MDAELALLFNTLIAITDFEARYAKVIRMAMDYVIDGKRMGRTRLAEAEKAEKTIFGMKVEAYLGYEFKWHRGSRLDFCIEGIEFDSKATIRTTWMIPREAIGKICLLTRIQELDNVFQAGLLRTELSELTAGSNQDKKRSVSAAGRGHIVWLIPEAEIPASQGDCTD